MSTRKMYGIYLPNSNEKWFVTTFSLESRAIDFAENSGLVFEEYDIRPTDSVVEEEVALEGAA